MTTSRQSAMGKSARGKIHKMLSLRSHVRKKGFTRQRIGGSVCVTTPGQAQHAALDMGGCVGWRELDYASDMSHECSGRAVTIKLQLKTAIISISRREEGSTMTKREGLRKNDFLESYVGSLVPRNVLTNRNSFSAGSLRLEPKLVKALQCKRKTPAIHQQSMRCDREGRRSQSIDTPTLCKREIWPSHPCWLPALRPTLLFPLLFFLILLFRFKKPFFLFLIFFKKKLLCFLTVIVHKTEWPNSEKHRTTCRTGLIVC